MLVYHTGLAEGNGLHAPNLDVKVGAGGIDGRNRHLIYDARGMRAVGSDKL